MDFWFDLPIWGRIIFSLVLMGIGGLIMYLYDIKLGMVFAGAGFVTLFFAGAGHDNGGYNF